MKALKSHRTAFIPRKHLGEVKQSVYFNGNAPGILSETFSVYVSICESLFSFVGFL